MRYLRFITAAVISQYSDGHSSVITRLALYTESRNDKVRTVLIICLPEEPFCRAAMCSIYPQTHHYGLPISFLSDLFLPYFSLPALGSPCSLLVPAGKEMAVSPNNNRQGNPALFYYMLFPVRNREFRIRLCQIEPWPMGWCVILLWLHGTREIATVKEIMNQTYRYVSSFEG